jgi:hypothetical protein
MEVASEAAQAASHPIDQQAKQIALRNAARE